MHTRLARRARPALDAGDGHDQGAELHASNRKLKQCSASILKLRMRSLRQGRYPERCEGGLLGGAGGTAVARVADYIAGRAEPKRRRPLRGAGTEDQFWRNTAIHVAHCRAIFTDPSRLKSSAILR